MFSDRAHVVIMDHFQMYGFPDYFASDNLPKISALVYLCLVFLPIVMDKTFRSKIGVGILSIVVAAVALPAFLLIDARAWVGLLIMLPIIAFVSLPYLGTIYRITPDGILLITCGYFLGKWSIDIASIHHVKRSRNPISSPALSMDRIEIIYGVNDSVIISPKEKTEFINAIKGYNKNIKVDL